MSSELVDTRFVSSELVGTWFVSSELVDSKTGPGDAGHVFAGIVRGPRDRWVDFIAIRSADLGTGCDVLFRRHQDDIAFRVFGAEDHALGLHAGQFGGL